MGATGDSAPRPSLRASAAELRAAAAFLGEVRDAQRLTGKSLSGRVDIDVATRSALERARLSSRMLGAADSVTDGALRQLLERFEEMCRRRKMEVAAGLRPALYKILAGELLANEDRLAAAADRLVPATLLHGDLTGLPDEPAFGSLGDTPGVFRYALTQSPTRPREFLKAVLETEAALAADDEFAQLRQTPWIFRRVALFCRRAPRESLRNALKLAASLRQEPTFDRFRDTPAIFIHAALIYPRSARARLVGAASLLPLLLEEGEFRPLHHMLGVLAHACLVYPSDPRPFLRKVLAGQPDIRPGAPLGGIDVE